MIRSPTLIALSHPINLAMLALTVAAGLCSAWWLAPIGFILWAIMVIVIARDPGLQMTFDRQNRQPLAQRFQTRFDRIDRARFSIFNAIGQSSSPGMQRTIEPIQTELDQLVNHAYQLGLRMSAMDNDFAVQNVTNNFDDEIVKIQKNLAASTDPNSRKEYETALQSLQARQAQLKTVSSLLSRFEAQLTGTNSAVDSVVTNVVSLKGLDPKQAADKVPAILGIIQNEQNVLKQFDDELEKTSLI